MDDLCEWYRRPDLGEQASSRLEAGGVTLQESGLCPECTSLAQEVLGARLDSSTSRDGREDIGSGSVTPMLLFGGYSFQKTYGQLRGDASFCALCRAIEDSVAMTQRYAAGHHPTQLPLGSHVWLDPVYGYDAELSGYFVRVVEDEKWGEDDYDTRWKGFLEVQVRETEPVRMLGNSSSSDATKGPETITIQGTTFRKAVPCRDMTQLLHLWLRECDSAHGVCRDHKNSLQNSTDAGMSASPTRLLEIQRVGRLFHIRLVAGNEIRTRYIALSHRWGDYTSIRTTTLNIESYQRGIDFDSLSPTLQQAVQITYAAGVRHLWVDCLCIVQDDDSEWALEAPKMGSLYANAYFTIAASAFEDKGCFPFKFSEDHGVTIDVHPGLELIISPRSSDFTRQSIRHEPLQKRAWTLQERLLSQRILYCSRYEYYWLCREQQLRAWGGPGDWFEVWSVTPGFHCDLYPLMLPHSTGSRMAAMMMGYWLLCEYSSCQLTLARDKLIAVSSLIDIFRDWVGSRCLHGLWECDLAHGILWYMSIHWSNDFVDWGPGQDVKAFKPDKSRLWYARPTRAPSWSWASMDGLQKQSVVWLSELTDYLEHPLNELPYAKVAVASDDEHRLCLGGELPPDPWVLKISGRLSKAFYGYENADEQSDPGRVFWQMNREGGPQAFFFVADDPDFDIDEHVADAESSRLYVMPIAAHMGLVITPASDDDTVPLYRRVGVANFLVAIRSKYYLDGDKSEGSTAGTAGGDTEHATVQTDDRVTEALGPADETDTEAFDESADAASYTESESDSSSTKDSIKSEGKSYNATQIDTYRKAFAEELRGLGQAGVSETIFLR